MRIYALLAVFTALSIAACGSADPSPPAASAPQATAPAGTTSATSVAVATPTAPVETIASPATTAPDPDPATEGASATSPTDDEIDQAISDIDAEITAQAAATCVKQLSPLADALSELNSRLDIGMNYAQYGELVAGAKVKYDRINWTKALSGPGCARSGILLERGLNKYVSAYRRWNACIESPTCDSDGITTSACNAHGGTRRELSSRPRPGSTRSATRDRSPAGARRAWSVRSPRRSTETSRRRAPLSAPVASRSPNPPG